jgi:hypothetical protein
MIVKGAEHKVLHRESILASAKGSLQKSVCLGTLDGDQRMGFIHAFDLYILCLKLFSYLVLENFKVSIFASCVHHDMEFFIMNFCNDTVVFYTTLRGHDKA